jgi:hypothetical protein
MKVLYTTSDKRMTVEVEGKDNKEIFSQLAVFQEIYEARKCQACQSERVQFVVREVQGNTYYELRCMDCGSTLSFGQKRADGSLFPKRKDKSGEFLPNNGWVKWVDRSKLSDDDSPF